MFNGDIATARVDAFGNRRTFGGGLTLLIKTGLPPRTCWKCTVTYPASSFGMLPRSGGTGFSRRRSARIEPFPLGNDHLLTGTRFGRTNPADIGYWYRKAWRLWKMNSPWCNPHICRATCGWLAFYMKTPALFSLGFLLSACIAPAQDASAPPSGANLAVVAKPSSSSVSGDTRTSALNDGSNPRSSRGDRRGTYGNWPSRGTQWVQYEWSQPISTRQIEVYWWDDNQGVRLPKASRLKYWDGNEFVPVANASGLGVEGNKFNATTFDEVTTAKLRLEMDGDAENSTGILEWRVLDSGKSPDFPPTVSAGVDRVVILGGKTYLDGQAKSLKPGGAAGN
jgi:hypothetical protein